MMDKHTFFASLTDEAAKPDPQFIINLREQVVSIAGGTPPTSGFKFFSGSGPKLVAVAIVTSAVIGGVAATVMSGSPDPTPVVQAPTVSRVDETNDVLGDDDQPVEEESDATDEKTDDTTQDPEEENDPATPSTQPPQDNSPTPAPQPTPSPDPTDDPPTTVITPNQDYTVEFWTVPSFKLSPVMPTTPADFVLNNLADINFNWGQDSPDSSITKNHFVARASAAKFLDAGDYIMTVAADDGVRVYINGKMIHDRWNISGGANDKINFSVKSAETATDIVIEYFEFQDSAHFAVDLSLVKKSPSLEAERYSTLHSL